MTWDAFSARLTIVAATLVVLVTPLHAVDSGIGKAAAITTQVTGTIGGTSPAPLAKGDAVFQNQVIETDDSGVGQLEFLDSTKVAIGPGSSLTLDTFVYNPNKTADKVVIELGKGSFRFITGKSPHEAYEISTPTATLGLRGTAFDIRIAPDGEIALAMIDRGAVEACSKISHSCQVHDLIGKFLHITPSGIISIHDRWDDAFMGGLGFAQALPFMANQNVLRPAFKTTTRIANLYLKTAGNVVTAPVNAAKPIGNFLKKLNPFKN